ncbi:ATP phosphoribosyltransferase [Paenibacillus sp. BR2-3]
MLKHRDIPRLIELGYLDLGITSTEWLYENGSDLYIHKELDWCDTRISLISDKDSPVLSENTTIRCITEFPRITRDFFSRTNKNNVTIDNISGSSEALVPSIYNCCVDCVETGKTLLLHNLTEESIFYKSQIVLVSKHTVRNQTENLITTIMELMSHKEQNCTINGM